MDVLREILGKMFHYKTLMLGKTEEAIQCRAQEVRDAQNHHNIVSSQYCKVIIFQLK